MLHLLFAIKICQNVISVILDYMSPTRHGPVLIARQIDVPKDLTSKISLEVAYRQIEIVFINLSIHGKKPSIFKVPLPLK